MGIIFCLDADRKLLAAVNSAPAIPREPYRDNIALVAILFAYFVTMVTLSVFETVNTPLIMDEYALDAQQVGQ